MHASWTLLCMNPYMNAWFHKVNDNAAFTRVECEWTRCNRHTKLWRRTGGQTQTKSTGLSSDQTSVLSIRSVSELFMCSRTPQLCIHCCTVRGLEGGRRSCLREMLESVSFSLYIYIPILKCAGAYMCLRVVCMSWPPTPTHPPPCKSPSPPPPPPPLSLNDTEKERRRSGSPMWVYL